MNSFLQTARKAVVGAVSAGITAALGTGLAAYQAGSDLKVAVGAGAGAGVAAFVASLALVYKTTNAPSAPGGVTLSRAAGPLTGTEPKNATP